MTLIDVLNTLEKTASEPIPASAIAEPVVSTVDLQKLAEEKVAEWISQAEIFYRTFNKLAQEDMEKAAAMAVAQLPAPHLPTNEPYLSAPNITGTPMLPTNNSTTSVDAASLAVSATKVAETSSVVSQLYKQYFGEKN